MKKIHVLVEGQTEESFVTNILKPHLSIFNVFPNHVILKTKRIGSSPASRGGIVKYSKFKKEVYNLLNDSSSVLVTSMIDLYALPQDYPGQSEIQNEINPQDKVRIIEEAIEQDINNKKFLPYVELHEFEAMLFVEPEMLRNRFPGIANVQTSIRNLRRIKSEFPDPESIDLDNPPSKRILREFPEYDKVLHGILTLKEIGIEKIKRECPHFNEWLSYLEGLNTEDQ